MFYHIQLRKVRIVLGFLRTGVDHWLTPFRTDQVGGHEGVGEVVKLGLGVNESDIKVGDRVGVKWVGSICNRCGKNKFYAHLLCLHVNHGER